MRQLYPNAVADVDPADVYDDPRRLERRDRPYVFVNMVASVDGATVVDGVTEQLGSPGDRHVFFLLRSLADAIVVGAETVRAEGYGPAREREEFSAGRAARGQARVPRIAVVTRSLRLDWSSPLFTGAADRPLVLAPADANPERLDEARNSADVIAVGETELDLPAALASLAGAGIAALLCEGGPTLNGALLHHGLIDELCLTVSPTLVASGGGRRIMGAPDVPDVVGLDLVHVLEEEGSLFLRYLTNRSAS